MEQNYVIVTLCVGRTATQCLFTFKCIEQQRAKSHLQVAKAMIKYTTYNTHAANTLEPRKHLRMLRDRCVSVCHTGGPCRNEREPIRDRFVRQTSVSQSSH